MFDPNKPYDLEYTTTGIFYLQDGKKYTRGGLLVEDEKNFFCSCGRDFPTLRGLNLHKNRCGNVES